MTLSIEPPPRQSAMAIPPEIERFWNSPGWTDRERTPYGQQALCPCVTQAKPTNSVAIVNLVDTIWQPSLRCGPGRHVLCRRSTSEQSPADGLVIEARGEGRQRSCCEASTRACRPPAA